MGSSSLLLMRSDCTSAVLSNCEGQETLSMLKTAFCHTLRHQNPVSPFHRELVAYVLITPNISGKPASAVCNFRTNPEHDSDESGLITL